MTELKQSLSAAKARIGVVAKASPSLMKGFAEISRAATSQGAFSSAQKELMAVAIAVTKGCEECILYHADAARRHGADEPAFVEALEVAIEMGGGPTVMYAGKALEVFRALNRSQQ